MDISAERGLPIDTSNRQYGDMGNQWLEELGSREPRYERSDLCFLAQPRFPGNLFF